MHSVASENIVLVAPRPIRITANFFSNFHSHSPTHPHSFRLASAPPDAPDRLKPPEDENDDVARSASDKDLVSVSPRGSPRSSLPSEALEEFLSILRPSLFPPQSPTLIARRIPLTFAHERPTPLSSKPLDRLDNVPVRSPVLREDVRTPAKQTGMHLSPYLLTAREEDEENDTASEVVPFRMFGSGPLGSCCFAIKVYGSN
ncbi:hypothetical protein EWM64_g1723 [Hericium alpestre]|uniref:Uncharacterized protein n=1 Tax=Hericium alpestre TaxID=135208 RepID=A0A4Z0A5K0_9AGAM|nr:hypothetical protein EWM64_g1723 [Hericium alpestre]